MFIVVNVENWDIERAMPRQVLTAPQGASVLPDLPNWAWHEYGMRVGFWRLKAALDAHHIAPSMTINGTVPAAYPRVTRAARDAGWEFMGHGFRADRDASGGGPARDDPQRDRRVARGGRP